MEIEELEELVQTAIAGELPLVLSANGVTLDPTAVETASESLRARVISSLHRRGLRVVDREDGE